MHRVCLRMGAKEAAASVQRSTKHFMTLPVAMRQALLGVAETWDVTGTAYTQANAYLVSSSCVSLRCCNHKWSPATLILGLKESMQLVSRHLAQHFLHHAKRPSLSTRSTLGWRQARDQPNLRSIERRCLRLQPCIRSEGSLASMSCYPWRQVV